MLEDDFGGRRTTYSHPQKSWREPSKTDLSSVLAFYAPRLSQIALNVFFLLFQPCSYTGMPYSHHQPGGPCHLFRDARPADMLVICISFFHLAFLLLSSSPDLKMPSRRELSYHQRLDVLLLWQNHSKAAEISAALHIPRRTVQRVIHLWKTEERLTAKPRSGRPRKTTSRANSLLRRIALSTPLQSTTQLLHRWGEDVSTDTVVRRLREVGIVRRKALQKPYLSVLHKAKRLAFCLKYKDWGVEEWNKVLFTDEAKIEIPKPQSVWRKKGEELRPRHVVGTRRWGVNVMIWGSISAKGPGPFILLFGAMGRL